MGLPGYNLLSVPFKPTIRKESATEQVPLDLQVHRGTVRGRAPSGVVRQLSGASSQPLPPYQTSSPCRSVSPETAVVAARRCSPVNPRHLPLRASTSIRTVRVHTLCASDVRTLRHPCSPSSSTPASPAEEISKLLPQTSLPTLAPQVSEALDAIKNFATVLEQPDVTRTVERPEERAETLTTVRERSQVVTQRRQPPLSSLWEDNAVLTKIIVRGLYEKVAQKAQEASAPKLFHVWNDDGRVHTGRVPLGREELSEQDAFVLHVGDTIFVYAGMYCSAAERRSAAWFAHQREVGHPEARTQEVDARFWNLLGAGSMSRTKRSRVTTEQSHSIELVELHHDARSQSQEQWPSLLHVWEDNKQGPKVHAVCVPIAQGSLSDADAFLLDLGDTLYVYAGPSCSTTQKGAAGWLAFKRQADRGSAKVVHEVDETFWNMLGTDTSASSRKDRERSCPTESHAWSPTGLVFSPSSSQRSRLRTFTDSHEVSEFRRYANHRATSILSELHERHGKAAKRGSQSSDESTQPGSSKTNSLRTSILSAGTSDMRACSNADPGSATDEDKAHSRRAGHLHHAAMTCSSEQLAASIHPLLMQLRARSALGDGDAANRGEDVSGEDTGNDRQLGQSSKAAQTDPENGQDLATLAPRAKRDAKTAEVPEKHTLEVSERASRRSFSRVQKEAATAAVRSGAAHRSSVAPRFSVGKRPSQTPERSEGHRAGPRASEVDSRARQPSQRARRGSVEKEEQSQTDLPLSDQSEQDVDRSLDQTESRHSRVPTAKGPRKFGSMKVRPPRLPSPPREPVLAKSRIREEANADVKPRRLGFRSS